MPVWAIALGVTILVGLGAFFVFKSFASSGSNNEASPVGVPGSDVSCHQGYCYLSIGKGNQDGKWCQVTSRKPVRYTCF